MTQNNKIIKEFDKLVDYIKENKDEPNNLFRLKSAKLVVSILKKYPKKITLENLDEFNEIKGIGKGTIDRVREILENGFLKELEDYIPAKPTKKEVTSNELETVIGIGNKTAQEFINSGIKSVKDLKSKVKSGDITVSPTIQMGLKYHNVYKENIPRDEIDDIKNLLTSTFPKKYQFEICGSYRRMLSTSSDIDILITSKEESKTNHLVLLVEQLKEKININNNKPFLVDSLVHNNKTKYMGFCKYKNNPVRRIDIRYVKYDNFYTALLYFTGSAEFNRNMRNNAKKLGYKLSEYGLVNIKERKASKISSEKDIFDIIDMNYIEPRDR
jgi:DNA polymerase/3'-5' exonuclease PolX